MFAYSQLALVRRGLIKMTLEERAELEAFETAWIKVGGKFPKLEDEEQKAHHYIIKPGDFRRTRVHIEPDADGNDVFYPVVDGKVDRTSPLPSTSKKSSSNGSEKKS